MIGLLVGLGQMRARPEIIDLVAGKVARGRFRMNSTAEPDDRKDFNVSSIPALVRVVFSVRVPLLGAMSDRFVLRLEDGFNALSQLGIVDSPTPVKVTAQDVNEVRGLAGETWKVWHERRNWTRLSSIPEVRT